MLIPEAIIQAKEILYEIQNHHYKAFIVGGAVRDLLLGLRIHDVDIATSASPQQIMAIFPITFPVGIEHGTVIVRFNRVDYEVTTFRSESDYKDFRHPGSVTFEHSLEKDLARRDFTVNAMAMNDEGEIIDPYNGQADLSNRLLKTVGNAVERFEEDPLRILRAARFVSQLDFHPYEVLRKAMIEKRERVKKLSIERIHQEFTKLLQGQWATKGLELLIKTGVLFCLPSFERLTTSNVRGCLSLDFQAVKRPFEAWTAFLLSVPLIEPEAFLKTWRFSKKEENTILRSIQLFLEYRAKQWDSMVIYKYGIEQVMVVERIKAAFNNQDQVSADYAVMLNDALPITSRKDLAADGHDLQTWLKQTPGPWIERLLQDIETAVIQGKVNNEKADIKKWVELCHKQKKKY